MKHLKTETDMRDMINKGRLHDALSRGEQFLKDYGTNTTIQHLVASIYFAQQNYISAWFYIHRNPESDLKKNIFRKIQWLYPDPYRG